MTENEVTISRPNLDLVAQSAPSVQAAFLKVLTAIAASDGSVCISEYDQLVDVATKLDASPIASYCTLRHIEEPAGFSSAIAELKGKSSSILEHERRSLFDLALPLLHLQGDQASKYAIDLGKALGMSLTEHELHHFQSGPTPTFWKTITAHSVRRIKGREPLAQARDCIRITGNPGLAKQVVSYLDGDIEVRDLEAHVALQINDFKKQLAAFKSSIDGHLPSEEKGRRYQQTAEALLKQVNQRLVLLKARIDLEKDEFTQEFEEVVHDAGNAFELDVLERLKSSSWTLEKVWAGIGSTTFGKELERRIDRLTRRHEERLRLYKEELRLFSEEYRLTRVSLLNRTHHTELARSMPNLRAGTKVLNAVEGVADATIGGGVLAGVGTGTAMYFLGASTVLPVIAPVVPFVGAALLVAGAIKWMMDSSGRKDEEVRHKRDAFEAGLRTKMDDIRVSYFSQLDTLMVEFVKTARAMVDPVLLEADAVQRLQGLQSKVAQRLISDAHQSIKRLGHDVVS